MYAVVGITNTRGSAVGGGGDIFQNPCFCKCRHTLGQQIACSSLVLPLLLSRGCFLLAAWCLRVVIGASINALMLPSFPGRGTAVYRSPDVFERYKPRVTVAVCSFGVCSLLLPAAAAARARGISSRDGDGMRMSDTDFAEYDSKVTFMFPGQGAQYMGMAAEICDEV